MLGNLIAGVVSGLFVTLSVFVFRIFWKSKLVPWFEERVYKDAKIEGEWFSLYPTGKSHREEVNRFKATWAFSNRNYGVRKEPYGA